jgi:hypothetical protein
LNGLVGCEIRLVIGRVGSITEVSGLADLISQTITYESSAADISIHGIS